jgi:hypothetical protein
VAVFELGCPVTSVAWSTGGATIYAVALDNVICASLFVCLDEILMQYLGSRFTEAGRGIHAEWSYRYSHWACDIAEWVLSSSPSFSSQTIIHDIRPFAPSLNRVPSRIERFACWLREHPPQKRLKSRGWWTPRCSRRCGPYRHHMGRGKFQDLV